MACVPCASGMPAVFCCAPALGACLLGRRYTDKQGARNEECLSLGVDEDSLPAAPEARGAAWPVSSRDDKLLLGSRERAAQSGQPLVPSLRVVFCLYGVAFPCTWHGHLPRTQLPDPCNRAAA
ncbi:hypothetical protein HaLaN_13796 [Haematococcus lacustris]|uniref:Uncharacterized protein n=1 Tax=Haematococcus lacustris TaxID=44745 RepID=A0A699ZEA4_HAELA|nr:hypothetical protein HaLaN_13796 [Haematococcus lacustris]